MAHPSVSRPRLDERESSPDSPNCAPELSGKFPSGSVRQMPSRVESASVKSGTVKAQPVTRDIDFWTAALNVVVVGLAALLGWMVGRAGWKSASTPAANPNAVVSAPVLEETAQPAVPDPTDLPTQAAPPPIKPKPAAKPKPQTVPPGSLVVYQGSRIVFEAPPTSFGKTVATGHGPGVEVASSIPDHYIQFRVDPEYPESARAKHIQGRVVLNLTIDADGHVKEVTQLSGNPLLASAAAEAVRQWRFTPVSDPSRQSFRARINVDFRLPESQ